MRNILSLFSIFFFFLVVPAFAQKAVPKGKREYMTIRVYHAADPAQLEAIEQYGHASLLPALEKNGFTRTGFFKSIDNDTARDKRFYVIIPFSTLTQLEKLNEVIDKTLSDSLSSSAYITAVYNAPPYTRMENILLQAFAGAPQVKVPKLNGEANEKVYELRSYESATEALHLNKVKMFNAGEIQLFQRLGFNAVFYGQVLAGSQMPNLMYMTSFVNKAARDEHWKNFGSDPEWKSMSSKPEYQHNVSRINIVFLRPTSYSKL
jgi:hypothetical protein